MLQAKARLLLLSVLAGVFFFIAPGKAHARRGGIILITSGETIASVEALPPDAREVARDAIGMDVEVGYAYSYAGVFWIDIWTWDGEFCLYNGDNYWPLDEETSQALLGKSLSDLDRPLLYRFPPLLVILVVGGIGFGVWRYFESRRHAEALAGLLTDPRYTKAAEIFAAGGADPLEEALAYLETQGIAREYAYENLEYVLSRRV